jgi:hypothetical protein
MSADVQPLIDAEQAAFLQRGVSITAGSAGSGKFPNLCRALGCRISEDRRSVSLLLARSQAEALLADVLGNGRLAVVFSEPSTHRTIQLKGSDAVLATPGQEDLRAVALHGAAFIAELQPLGFSASLVAALLSCPETDIVAIRFTPDAAFTQTPGPRAGNKLQAGA